MAANPLFHSLKSRGQRANSALRNVNLSTNVLGSRDDPKTEIGKSPRRRSNMADDRGHEPPDKRRRLETGGGGDGIDEFWDDGDFDFTQEQLENIDCLVSMSQVGGQPDLGGENVSNVGRRSVGRGTPRSASTGDVKSSKGLKSLSLNKDRSGGAPYFEYPGKISEHLPAGSTSSFRGGTSSSGIGSMSSTFGSVGPAPTNQMKVPSAMPAARMPHGKQTQYTPPPPVSISSTSAGSRNPSITANNGQSSDLVSSTQKELESMKKMLGDYKHQLEEMKQSQYSKDGQIKMLRLSLTERENEVATLKCDKVAHIEQEQRQHTEKEKNREKELERLKTQLQFKEHEILELQGTCRKLEVKSRSSSSTSNSEGQTSPRRPGTTSPRRAHLHSPHVTRSPRVGDAAHASDFPNSRTFMSEEGSPVKSGPATKSTCHSTSSETIAAPKIDTPGRMTVKATKKPKIRPNRTILNIPNSRGLISGPSLVAKLVQPMNLTHLSAATAVKNPAPQRTPTPQGLVSLLQTPPMHLNTDSLKLQRAPGCSGFSPLRPKRTTPSASSSSSSVTTSIRTISSNSSSQEPCIVGHKNYNLATQAVTDLLNKDHFDDGSFAIDQYLPSDTQSAILLLPVIEDYLQAYLNLIHSSIETCSMSQGGSLQSMESSVDTLTSSVKNLMSDGTSYANHLELCALNSLKLLNILVNYSSHVRIALSTDGTSRDLTISEHPASSHSTTENNNYKAAPQVCTKAAPAASGPSSSDTVILGPSHLTTGNSSTASSSHLNVTISRVICDSQLLDQVIKAANPLLPNNQLANQNIIETSLQILASIAQGSSHHPSRFRAIFTQEVVLNCLSDVSLPTQSCCSLHICVLDVLISLARFPFMLDIICNQSDECPLLFMYHVASSSHKRETEATQTLLTTKVLEFISSFVAHHKTAINIILESDCHCSVDVVKCLVQMLNRELHVFQRSSSNLPVLRRGVALLQTISKHGKLHSRFLKEAERAYVELICGLHRIFRQHKHITEHENGAIDELWNFDQDCPDSDHDHEQDPENEYDDGRDKAMDTDDKS